MYTNTNNTTNNTPNITTNNATNKTPNNKLLQQILRYFKVTNNKDLKSNKIYPELSSACPHSWF
jgi:hypothetical protein